MMREFARMGAGNLWRLKLRTGLTAAGVAIGIGAMVSMLAFALGMQRQVVAQFRDLGLFHTLHVMSRSAGPGPDSTAVPLNDAALRAIAALPGVNLVHPQDTFDARATWSGASAEAAAQALPASFVRTRTLGRLLAGRFFDADSAREAVISRRLARRLGAEPESILGDTLVLRVSGRGDLARALLRQYLPRLGLEPEAQEAVDRLAAVFLRRLGADEARVAVCGVADMEGGWGLRARDVILPAGVAAGLDRLGFDDPLELLARLSAGGAPGYSLAIVTIEERADHRAVRQAIEDLGHRVISFADQFAEMRRGFLVFDAIVGVLGLIALVVASLGIVNTMVMSILERTREIGILKSLGAEDGQIRLLFLIETALIGLIGSLLGLGLGWGITRIGSLVVKRIMVAQDVPPLEMFHIPFYLVLGAIAFGVGVSLAAGLYPAGRAARVDPVQALRGE
jgi:putative ABC transport system permease protein